MAEPPGRREVSLEGGSNEAPRSQTRLTGGVQLNMQEMLEQQNQRPPIKSRLSPETLHGLANLKAAQEAANPQPQPEEGQPEEGQPDPRPVEEAPSPPSPPPADEERSPYQAPTTSEESLMGADIQSNPFNDPERRKIIEQRCADLSFDSLLMDREIRQRVPIRPGAFEPEYRSHTAGEERYIKRRLYEATQSGMSSSQFQSMLASYTLALSLVSLNETKLPSHLDSKGQIEDAKFDAKVQWIERLPAVIVGDLTTNGAWFEERLRNLLTEKSIKNG